jgi:hypothetical protein
VGRASIAIVVAARAICSCGSPAEKPTPAQSDDLAFDFDLTSKPGFMDQALRIENRGTSGVAPVLAFTPLDGSGNTLPGVTVATAYGSDEGRVVVPPRSIVFDVLRFDATLRMSTSARRCVCRRRCADG